MKISPRLMYLGIAALTLSVAAGCAQQQQRAEPEPEPVAAPDAKQIEAERAIAAAKDAIARAKAADWVWRDTEATLKKAEEAYKEGKYDDAIKLANKAKFEAEMALQQKATEEQTDRGLRIDGAGAASTYTVARGDSLWAISGKPDVYADPFMWPLIYKSNTDKIQDADLIYPGQELDIDASPSDSDVDAAVRHARTRGEWSIGGVEDSDRAYLGR